MQGGVRTEPEHTHVCELGYSVTEARHMAVVAYSAYPGCVQLAAHGLLASDNAGLKRQLLTLERVLTPTLQRTR